MLAIDTETTLFGNAEPVPRLVSIAVSDGQRTELLHRTDDWRPLVLHALAHGCVFQNAPFDVFVLLRVCPDLLGPVLDAYTYGRIHDTTTRERLIDIAYGRGIRHKYNLDALAARHGEHVDKADPWRLRYGELINTPIAHWPEGARRYASEDARVTAVIYAGQEHAASEFVRLTGRADWQIFVDEANQNRKNIALHAQSLRGIRTDPEQVARLNESLVAEMVHCAEIMHRHGLIRIGGTKARPKFVRNEKAAQALCAREWLATGRNPVLTEKGAVSLSEDALIALDAPADHPLDAFRRYAAVQNLRTKTIPIFSRPWIRPRYSNPVDSGRASCGKPQGKRAIEDVGPDEWVGTNLQNLARPDTWPGFRECLVPAPGYVFASGDWSAVELGTLAQVQIDLFGRSALSDALRAGRDPHADFGARILGIDPATFNRKLDEHEHARQLAKAWNFGKPGGMGSARFIAWAAKSYGVKVTESEERRHTRSWREQWPETQLFFDYVKALAGADGLITIKQPRSGRIRGGCRFPDACNTHFQGLAADVAGDTLWMLWLASLDSRSPLYAGPYAVDPATGHVPVKGQVLFVHDENVTQAPADEASKVLDEQDRIMVAMFSKWCPDVPIKVESKIQARYEK